MWNRDSILKHTTKKLSYLLIQSLILAQSGIFQRGLRSYLKGDKLLTLFLKTPVQPNRRKPPTKCFYKPPHLLVCSYVWSKIHKPK